jgi:hypothetical protein
MTNDLSAGPDRARVLRMLRLVAAGAVIEIALVIVVKLSPAMRVLMRPVYWIVAAVVLFAVWHAWRRGGADRRHGERRHGDRRHSS